MDWKEFPDHIPKAQGWYSELHCWDVSEGFLPGASYWDGKFFFRGSGPITHFIDRAFDNQAEAYNNAYKLDPNW